MTRAQAKSLMTIDRAIPIVGFLALFIAAGISYGLMQGDLKAVAKDITNVRVDYMRADSGIRDANTTRFRSIDAKDEILSSIITTQAILIERLVTTTEFIQRDLSKLVDQNGD